MTLLVRDVPATDQTEDKREHAAYQTETYESQPPANNTPMIPSTSAAIANPLA